MAAAHDVLTANDWRGAELGEILRQQLSQYVAEQRVSLAGVKVNLPAEQAAPLSLIFNELATNALKYGALSTPRGRIVVSWTLAMAQGRPHVALTWEERDGPVVTSPLSRGFGSTLIEKSLPEARVTIDYRPQGLLCSLTWPSATPEK